MDIQDADESGEILEPAEERQYTYREKALRDYFVKEYLGDYDEVAAAIRIGYPRKYAREFASRFMNEPYVVRKIKEQEGTINALADDPEAAKKRIISGLTREANYRGPGSSQAARVAALSRLATLYKMDPKDAPKDDSVDPLEGAFVVPGVLTEEQWEEYAAKQQEALANGTIMPAPNSVN